MESDIDCHLAHPATPPQESDPPRFLDSFDPGGLTKAGAAGGPLTVPGFASGRINVESFRQSCATLVLALLAELEDPAIPVDDIDVRVDDLRIMTDAMLVEKALAEVLKDARNGERTIVVASGTMASNGVTMDTDATNSGTGTLASVNQIAACDSSSKRRNKKERRGMKRGRPYDRHTRVPLLMDDTDDRRKEALARLKLERDQARASVSLHSVRAKQERELMLSKVRTQIRTLRFLTSALKTPKLAPTTLHEPLPKDEVLITVEIYDNVKRNLKVQEFLVVGRQPLTALKDRIYCLTDTVAEKADAKLPSSYFFIEDVFYNDMRDPKAVDYSKPIRKWAMEQTDVIERWKSLGGVELKKKLWLGLPSLQRTSKPPVFSTARMEDVCFADLECRIGAQFLYCHQGDCKHNVVVRDMRLAHCEDVENAAAYPVLRYVHKLRHRKCNICFIYQAKKVTVGDKLAPENPCFFCENCYYLLHYSNEGNLLYSDFQVQDYYHE